MGTPFLARYSNHARVFGSASKMDPRSPMTRTVTPERCLFDDGLRDLAVIQVPGRDVETLLLGVDHSNDLGLGIVTGGREEGSGPGGWAVAETAANNNMAAARETIEQRRATGCPARGRGNAISLETICHIYPEHRCCSEHPSRRTQAHRCQFFHLCKPDSRSDSRGSGRAVELLTNIGAKERHQFYGNAPRTVCPE